MEPFTKAGDKNPTGIEHRDLKQRKGNQYQKKTPPRTGGRGTSGRPVKCFKNCGKQEQAAQLWKETLNQHA